MPGSSSGSREPLHETVAMVLRYQAGDDRELAELLTKLQPRILRVARLSMGAKVRSRFDSMDVAQDVAADLILDLRKVSIEEPGDLVMWLAAVVRNNVRGKARKLGTLKNDPDLEVAIDASRPAVSGLHFREQLAGFETPPLERLARDEDQQLVDAALAELKPEYREVIMLRALAGLSYRAITKRMQRPSEEATAALYVRALSKLKRQLKCSEQDSH
jgi:RNA polymerase sigma-70 factor, ECF subfamily